MSSSEPPYNIFRTKEFDYPPGGSIEEENNNALWNEKMMILETNIIYTKIDQMSWSFN